MHLNYMNELLEQDGCLVRYCTVIEAVGSTNTSVNTYQTTQRNIPEDSQLDDLRTSNLTFLGQHGNTSVTVDHKEM